MDDGWVGGRGDEINKWIFMKTKEFVIPIDKEINDFLHHLYTHPRTILSAKFGDGKSYFLDKFEKDTRVNKAFKLIKIYPVNYQVAGNVDVFNLLKYDILLQLLVEGMVSEEAIEEPALGGEDGAEILSSLLEGFADVNPSPAAALPKSSFNILNKISSLRSKYVIQKGGENSARELLKMYENSSPQYGFDYMSRLIRHSLRAWKKKKSQKVVLVVEDMDRIDPSHLFRIMNLFSSQMDDVYRYGEPPSNDQGGGRFGFDNIVFVLDYANLEQLFSHFYGNGVSFKGYVSKFIPQGYFEYSLRRSADTYFYGVINSITGLDRFQIGSLLGLRIDKVSIRDMFYAIKDVDSQVSFEQTEGVNSSFLYMLVIMRRIGMEDEEIIKMCENLYIQRPEQFIRCVIDFTLLDGFSYRKGYLKSSNTMALHIIGRREDGFAEIGRITPVPERAEIFDIRKFVLKLLTLVRH